MVLATAVRNTKSNAGDCYRIKIAIGKGLPPQRYGDTEIVVCVRTGSGSDRGQNSPVATAPGSDFFLCAASVFSQVSVMKKIMFTYCFSQCVWLILS